MNNVQANTDDTINLAEQIAKYRNFIHEILQPRLEVKVEQKAKVTQDIQEFESLLELLQEQQHQPEKSMKVLMDIGQNFHVRAKTSASLVYITIEVGLGFFVDMTISEAIETYLPQQLLHLQKKEAEVHAQAQDISSHIQQILLATHQLSQCR